MGSVKDADTEQPEIEVVTSVKPEDGPEAYEPHPGANEEGPEARESHPGAIDNPGDAELVVEPGETPPVDEVTGLAGLTRQVQETRDSITSELAGFSIRATAYEDTIRVLQEQAAAARQDMTWQLLKPMFTALASLHADTMKAAESASTRDEQAQEDLRYAAMKIEEIFELMDLVSIGAGPGMSLQPRLHQVVRSIDTEDSERAGLIEAVVRQGFMLAGNDRPYIPARVVVYRASSRHHEAATSPASATSTTSEGTTHD